MRRVYRNIHIALITALLIAAVAFEVGAADRTGEEFMAPALWTATDAAR